MSDSNPRDPQKKPGSQPPPNTPENEGFPFFDSEAGADASAADDQPIAFDSQDGLELPDEWMKSGDALLVDSNADDFEPLASSDSVYEYSSQDGLDSPTLAESVEGLLADDEPVDSRAQTPAPIATPQEEISEDDAAAFLLDDDEAEVSLDAEDSEDQPIAVAEDEDEDDQPMALDDDEPISDEDLDDQPVAVADDEEDTDQPIAVEEKAVLDEEAVLEVEADAEGDAVLEDDVAVEEEPVIEEEAVLEDEAEFDVDAFLEAEEEPVVEERAALVDEIDDQPVSLDDAAEDEVAVALDEPHSEHDVTGMESQDHIDIPPEWLASGDGVLAESPDDETPPAVEKSAALLESDDVFEFSSQAGTDSEARVPSDVEMMSDDGAKLLFGSEAEMVSDDGADFVLQPSSDAVVSKFASSAGDVASESNASDVGSASDAGSMTDSSATSDSGIEVSDSGAAFDKTMQSDEYEELVGSGSVSDSAAQSDADDASDAGAVSDSGFPMDSQSESDAVAGDVEVDKTMQSDDFEEYAAVSDSATMSDSGDFSASGSAAGSDVVAGDVEVDKTMQSDDFEEYAAVSDSATMSDSGDFSASESAASSDVVASDVEVDKTMQSDDFEEYADISDSQTLSDSGVVAGSDAGSDAEAMDFDKTMQSDDFAEASDQGRVSSSADSQMLSDSGVGGGDYDQTMVSDDYAVANQEEYGKTIAIHDFEDDAPRGWLGGDDPYDKTMAAEEFGAPGDAFGKTMLSDSGEMPAEGSSAAGWDEAKTMMDDGSVVGEDAGQTMFLDDERQPGKRPPPATVTQNLQTRQPGAAGPTRWEGSQTSGMATSSPGATVGTNRESLTVASRSVSGMTFGDENVGDYRLVKQLGEGGMGVVYVAKQSSLARDVVFKTLKPMAADQQAKLKSEGRYKSVIDHRTKMFLSEAVVTADLFHPNIVPIYELGEAPDGSLFYAMKWVRGEPWHKKFKEMTLEDNLEVLMKVADAIAFAHARQIVNRDLKPENVMLGEYGEVIVLDWGLALPFGEAEKRLPLSLTAGLGSGTPAYMPPELITGPLNKIGPAADIYLLGAMLFELVTGVPPHEFNMPAQSSARQKMAEVRRIVSENIIRPADELLTRFEVKHRVVMANEIRSTEHRGELIDICKKAMATKPEDRYRTVQEFQHAIREYEKHSTSRILCDRATEMATETKPDESDATLHGYTRYQNSLALYQESLREWSGNDDARDGLTRTQLNLAELALSNGDYDLGLSVLDSEVDSHDDARTKLIAAKKDREGHARRMKMLKIAAVVLMCMFGLVSAIAAKFQFNLKAAVELADKASKDAKLAEEAKDQAEGNLKVAEEKTVAAEEKTKQAEVAFVAANKAKMEAETSKKDAEEKLEIAKTDLELADTKLQEAGEKLKVADTKLVKANDELKMAEEKVVIADEKLKVADTKLADANKNLEKANESLTAAQERVADASYRAGLADADRHVREGRYPDARKKLAELKTRYAERCKIEWQLLWDTVEEGQAVSLGRPLESLGLSRDGRVLAAVENDGNVVVWPVDENGLIAEDKPQRLNHGARPRTVVVSPSGALIAVAGDTGAVQIWSVKESRAIAELVGHSGGVNAVQFSNDEKQLVSGGDDRTLRVWDVSAGRELVSVKCLYAVHCIDWSAKGETLVAGTGTADEVSGLAYAWSVQANSAAIELREIRRFQAPPSGTVKQSRGVVAIALTADSQHVVSSGPGSELFVWQVRKLNGEPLVTSKVTDFAARIGNHSKRVERVRSLAFSTDGSRLIAGGDDGTISVWERSPTANGSAAMLPRFDRGLVLYGHSGPVRTCRLLPQAPDRIVSASYDQHVWVWNLKTYPKSRQWLDQPAADDGQKAAVIRPELDWFFAFNEPISRPETRIIFDHKTHGVAEKPAISLMPGPIGPAFFLPIDQLAWLDSNESQGADAKSPVRIVTGHTDSVLSASFQRDGTRLLTSSRDQTARVWDTQTGKPIRAQDGSMPFDDNVLAEGHAFDVFATLFFPSGDKLLTSSFDGTMRIWDARVEPQLLAGRELATLPETGMFGVMDISQDGEWIVTAGRGNAAQLWKVADVLQQRRPQPVRLFDGQHRFRVTSITLSPDNKLVLTADREGNIVIWSADDGSVLGRKRAAHSGELTKAVFLKSGSQLLTASVDRRVTLWTVDRTANEVALQTTKRFEHDGMVMNLALSPQGDRFLTVTRKGARSVKAKGAKNSDDDKLSGPVSLTTLRLWNLADGTSQVLELPPLAPSETEESAIRGTVTPAWNADGKQAVITSADGMLHLLDADTGRFTQSLAITELINGGNRLRAVAAIFPPHESPAKHLVTQSQNGVTLWRLADGAKLMTFRPQGVLFSSSYSSDGKLVATGGQSLRLFDADETSPRFGRSLHKIESPHGGIVTSVEFSPVENSQRFVTTSWDGTVRLWEWQPAEQTARMLHSLAGHEGPVRFGTWSPDGQRILTVGHDARPRVWTLGDDSSAPTAVELPVDTDRDFDHLCGAFSWDGQFVAVGGRDVATQESLGWIWRLPSEPGQPATRHAIVRGHGLGGINAIVFHPLDDRLLTAGTDGTARVWDWQKNRKPGDEPLDAVFLLSLTRPGETTTHRGPVTSLRITPDGKIATASADGTAMIWLISRSAALPKVEG